MERRLFIKYGSQTSLGMFFLGAGVRKGYSLQSEVGNTHGKKDSRFLSPKSDLIGAPDDPASWPAFRKELVSWRKKMKKAIVYDGSRYDRPELAWTSSAYNCYFLMLCDQVIYDHEKRVYAVDGFLEKCEREFGRIDMVVLWHAYPRIGLDERNQFDFYRDMPGGIPGLRKLTKDFHHKNVRVFINYNPWDTGTRREPKADNEVLADMIRDMDADGIFLDTLSQGKMELLEAIDAIKAGVALESELALPVEQISNHQMSWAQWFNDTTVPGILRNKWFERRHIQHGISRWNTDKTPELHTAWMNGSGIMIMENVFGQWMGWNNRDKSILRSLSPIQKRYSSLFSGEGWTPLALQTENGRLFTSEWQAEGIRLWTLVNRSDSVIRGNLICVDDCDDDFYYDLVRGKEAVVQKKGKKCLLEGEILSGGIGCFAAIQPAFLGDDFREFLASQAQIIQGGDTSTDFPALHACLKPVPRSQSHSSPPKGMVWIPSFRGIQQVVFRVRETGYYSSTDPSFINAVYPRLHHENRTTTNVSVPAFLIDEIPVTNILFREFLEKSHYRPSDHHNFLKHWPNGKIPYGKEEHPVVYVDLEDARAYAKWAGKRLPTEKEWQFAGQGYENRKYPWGDEWKNGLCNDGEKVDTTPVRFFTDGRSPFGCFDMCGNVWELTESEHNDGRTRFCILKGGSFYKAMHSEWYFDGGPKPMDFNAKQLLMYPGIDRCSTVGFRCAANLENNISK